MHRSGQWVEITMSKVQKLLSITDSDERKHVLDYTHVDLHYVEDQRKNLLSKYNSLKQEFSSCNEHVPGNIVMALGGTGKRKEKGSSKEIVFTKSDVSTFENNPELPSELESDDNTQIPLGSSKKVLMIPKPYVPCKYSGFNDHHSDECPKVVFGDNSSGDTEGYGSVNCNGITFPKTHGTIFNQNQEVVLIAPERRDVYVENLNEVKVKELRSDNRTEFRNHKLEEFCDDKGISQNFSTSIIVKRHGKIVYDVFRGRSPDISYFHVFGYLVHIHNHRDHLGKFDEKADDGFFLGYSLVAKAFRVFNIRRQEMEETYHVTFNEDDEAISQTST
ncbi:retrovirus-related pol polyprotein from transposon TNT 1-94 [Tanacetum coccineum]